MKRLFLLSLGAVLALGAPGFGADPAEALVGALRGLRAAPHYAWTATTELPGAPFKLAPVRGRADAEGWLAVETESDGKPRQAFGRGKERVFQVGGAWKSRAEIDGLKGADQRAAQELFAARPPADELAALLPLLGGVRREADGSCYGALPEEAAKELMLAVMKGRAPGGFAPEITGAVGHVRVWLHEGRPQKYVISVSATAALPFGRKEIKRISTVEIGEVGTNRFEVPAAAKEKLGTLSSK